MFFESEIELIAFWSSFWSSLSNSTCDVISIKSSASGEDEVASLLILTCSSVNIYGCSCSIILTANEINAFFEECIK